MFPRHGRDMDAWPRLRARPVRYKGLSVIASAFKQHHLGWLHSYDTAPADIYAARVGNVD